MIFKLDGFYDLGKCAYATLKETFNTETDKIFLRDKEVHVEKIEDLFPYLWNIAGCEIKNDNETRATFFEPGYWWNRYYKDSNSEVIQRMLDTMNKEVLEQQQKLVELNANSSTK